MVDILDFPENHVSSSLEKTVKPLEVPKSDHAGRPRFHDGIDAFSTPRRPSKHRRRGLSGTPRPASDPPPTDLCRRPYPVISGMITIDTRRKPCRDPRRDVGIVVVDAFLPAPHVVKRVLKRYLAGHIF